MSRSTTEHRLLSRRYRIEAFLGQGGMARVHRGTDLVLDRTVAIKILAEHMAGDPQAVRRFRREAQAAAGLSHPGIVAVYDTGSDGDIQYIVMEYITGRTLADILDNEGALPPERTVRVASAVASALATAHGKGIVHRDVKPGNIMITPSGEVKVMDFGIARAITTDTFTHTAAVLGTATYLSPEQARGEPADARSDLYSLGVVLYEMLAGRPPFAADSPVAVAYQHVREDPIPLSRVNPAIGAGLEAVVLKAMAKDRVARHQTAEELGRDLERAAVARTTTAAPGAHRTTEVVPVRGTAVLPPVAQQHHAEPPRGPRRSRSWTMWAVVLGALLAVALVASLILAGLSRQPVGGLGPTSPNSGASSRPPTTSPTPSNQAPPSVQSALNQLALILTEGVSSGELSRHAANEIAKDIRAAVSSYQNGDLEKALDKLEGLADKVGELQSKGQISSGRAKEVRHGISDLEAAMRASPPSGEEEGD